MNDQFLNDLKKLDYYNLFLIKSLEDNKDEIFNLIFISDFFVFNINFRIKCYNIINVLHESVRNRSFKKELKELIEHQIERHKNKEINESLENLICILKKKDINSKEFGEKIDLLLKIVF